ncbi:MAG: CARDB domain-containing protein [Gammaproteobacteria bacterium]
MTRSNNACAYDRSKESSVRCSFTRKLLYSYRLLWVLLFCLNPGSLVSAAPPEWADHAYDALQAYKRIVDYWVGRVEPDTRYAYFAVPGFPAPDPSTDSVSLVVERWNDDVELAQSLAAYWLLTGDQPLANMFRDMSIKIRRAPAIEYEVQGPPWIQPGDPRLVQGYTTTFVDPEHSAEETTLIFPRLAYVDFGEPVVIEQMIRLIWNFKDDVPGEQNWAQAVDTGFLMRSPMYNARNVSWCWSRVNDCSDPLNHFPHQDTAGNFRTLAPGLSLLWYFAPSHYLWQSSHPNGFMQGHNNAWIDASQRTEGNKPANIPPSKVYVDPLGGGAWQGYGVWEENDNTQNGTSTPKQGWNEDESIFRHFYHAMTAQMIATGATDARDIVGTAYTMRQNQILIGNNFAAFERQFLQWRPDIDNPQDYASEDAIMIAGVSGHIFLGGETDTLIKKLSRRVLAARLHIDSYISSGQSADLANAVHQATQSYLGLKTVLEREEAAWSTNLQPGSSGLTDQVKFHAGDAFLLAATGGSGIYDGAYPSMYISWNDTDAEVVSQVLERNSINTSLWAWNYGPQKEVGLRLWRFTEGQGELRIGPDANADGTMDSVTQTVPIAEIRKGTEVRFTIPSNALQLIQIIVTNPQPRDLTGLPDLAVGYQDIQIANDQARVTVHNIGTGATGNVTVRLLDTTSTVIGAVEQINLAGFTDMNPVTTSLNWTIPAGRTAGSVVLDQEQTVDEITELNNQWLVKDTDSDGLSDGFEITIGTDPNNADTDDDGLTDNYEACYDGDCLNYDPFHPETNSGGDLNATWSDTDQDGVEDGTEIAAGTDPLDSSSYPPPAVPGDINNDGQVNVADILLSQRHVLGLTMLSPDQISRGDLYPPGGDGQITLPDLLLIQKIVLSLP